MEWKLADTNDYFGHLFCFVCIPFQEERTLCFVRSLKNIHMKLISDPVFPDEKDDEEEYAVGIKTRSGRKYTMEENASKDEQPSVSKPAILQIADNLMEWKKSTLCFNECTSRKCDPLLKFLKLKVRRFIGCKSCLIVRDLLHKELFLICDKDEFGALLLNYTYFHALKVFDMSAEQRYAVDRPKHPYFASYTYLRRLNKILLVNMSSIFGILPSIKLIAQRPFIYQDFLHSESDFEKRQLSIRCEFCIDKLLIESLHLVKAKQLEARILWPFRLVILCGKRYSSRTLQFANKSTVEESLAEKQLMFCALHAVIFDCFHKLTHIDWNVHWNCHRQIVRLHEKQSDMTAEQLINAIDPAFFTKLVKFYKSIYKKLNFVKEKDGPVLVRSSLASGVCINRTRNVSMQARTLQKQMLACWKQWFRFVCWLKDDAIFNRITGMC